jgi:hypothetical protein
VRAGVSGQEATQDNRGQSRTQRASQVDRCAAQTACVTPRWRHHFTKATPPESQQCSKAAVVYVVVSVGGVDPWDPKTGTTSLKAGSAQGQGTERSTGSVRVTPPRLVLPPTAVVS